MSGDGLCNSPFERGGGGCYSTRGLTRVQHTPTNTKAFAPSLKRGARNLTYEKDSSLYILTKENGRWGVKFRSSYAE